MSTPDVEALNAALARLERTLVREGGILWRASILEGEPAEVDWPEDLPSLPPVLEAFFAWRSGGRMTDWRSAGWAVSEYRSSSVEETFPRSVVPVHGSSFVDTRDGRVWQRGVDDEGMYFYERAAHADLPALLDAIEKEFAARRLSPWRAKRVDRDEQPWLEIGEAPALEALADQDAGKALLGIFTIGRLTKGWLYTKLACGRWLTSGTIFVRPPLGAQESDSAIRWFRHELGSGEGFDEPIESEELATSLARLVQRWGPKGPWSIASGTWLECFVDGLERGVYVFDAVEGYHPRGLPGRRGRR